MIDSGIRFSHVDFGGRAVLGADFIGDGRNGNDCLGHGTHVAGTLGGGSHGVAKGVTLYAVRVFGCTSSGSSTVIIAGVDWVTANHVKPAVANMSLETIPNTAMDTAVRDSIDEGITYVIAAGNLNVDAGTRSPSRVVEGITVGATDIRDRRATFDVGASNYGSVLDLFAPGKAIVSAITPATRRQSRRRARPWRRRTWRARRRCTCRTTPGHRRRRWQPHSSTRQR